MQIKNKMSHKKKQNGEIRAWGLQKLATTRRSKVLATANSMWKLYE